MQLSRTQDPISQERETAVKQGVCPMRGLGQFHFDRWDMDTLCSAFSCSECVAEPGEWWPCATDETYATNGPDENWEIDF